MIGLISDVQHFSLVDGDGIRTCVFFKGCNLSCKWCHNPECISPEPQTLRFANGTVKKVGRAVTEEDLTAEILEDLAFYVKSGGGVTFTGGEPMRQIGFLVRMLANMREADIDTVVDTAGCVPYESFERCNEFNPHYYYDFKLPDGTGYTQWCGGDYATVRDNLRRLCAEGARVTVRIPVIPGVNADAQCHRRMADQLASLGATRVGLLPFHRLGTSKYDALGQSYRFSGIPSVRAEELVPFAEIYRKLGCTVKIEE